MGVQWAKTFLEIVALLLAVVPFVLFAGGETSLAKSEYPASQTVSRQTGEKESNATETLQDEISRPRDNSS